MSFYNKVSYEASSNLDGVIISVTESAEYTSSVSYEDAWLKAQELAKQKAESKLAKSLEKIKNENMNLVSLQGPPGSRGPQGFKGARGPPGPPIPNLATNITFNTNEELLNFTFPVPSDENSPSYINIYNNVSPFQSLGDNSNEKFLSKDASSATTGTNGIVYALAFDPDNNLYVGGDFTKVGNISTNNIAMWNGCSWSTLDNGLNGPVYSLSYDSDNDTLYAAGSFSKADPGGTNVSVKNVARWSGSKTQSWSSVGYDSGDGPDGPVYAMVIAETNEYKHPWIMIGGAFPSITYNGSARNIAYINAGKLDYTGNRKWLKTGANGLTKTLDGSDGAVYSLAYDVRRNSVLAGGDFLYNGSTNTKTDGTIKTFYNVAQWDQGNADSDDTFAQLTDGGVDGPVYALALNDSGVDVALYVGGNFTKAAVDNANPVSVNNIAKYNVLTDKNEWQNLNSNGPSSGPITALAVSSSSSEGIFIAAGGPFTTINGNTYNCIAYYEQNDQNGGTWDPYVSNDNNGVSLPESNGYVNDITGSDQKSVNAIIFVKTDTGSLAAIAGNFTSVCGTTANNICVNYSCDKSKSFRQDADEYSSSQSLGTIGNGLSVFQWEKITQKWKLIYYNKY